MANIVEFLVKIRDLASGQMRTLASNSEGSFNRISARANSTGRSIDQLNSRIDALTKTRDISLDTRQISRANTEIEKLEKKRDKLQNMGRSVSGGGTGILGGIGIMGAIYGGVALGREVIQDGVDRQISKIALETFVGKKPGDLLNDQLVGYATKSIYGNEIMSEGKLLAGGGVKANNIMPIMHMLGDLGAGDKEHMKSLALAFSEASSTGYLTGRQEMMMRTALFNPLEALSAITHKSGGELKKDMEKGKISIDMLVQAMEYATGPMGRWNNMENKIAGDGAGKWIAFKGALTTLAGTIGTKLLPVLGGLSDIMTGMITNKTALYEVGAAIGFMAAAWGVYTIAANFAAIASAAAFLLPLAALALIGAAIGYMIVDNDNLGKSADKAADKVDKANKKILASTQDAGASIYTFGVRLSFWWDTIAYGLQVAVLGIVSTFERVNRFMNGKVGGGLWQHFKDFGKDTEADKTINDLKKKHADRAKWYDLGYEADGKTKLGQGKGMMDILAKYTPGTVPPGTPKGTPDGMKDTADGITGGGVRNLTINIAKQGIDQITLHVATLKEGKAEIQDMFINMFNQVINSGNAAVNPN